MGSICNADWGSVSDGILTYENMPNQLQHFDTDILFKNNYFGKVIIFADADVKRDSIVLIDDYVGDHAKYPKRYKLGRINAGEGFEVSLLPGEYWATIWFKGDWSTNSTYKTERFIVKKGGIIYVELSKKGIATIETDNKQINLIDKGTIYSKADLEKRLRVDIAIKMHTEDNQQKNKELICIVKNNFDEPQFLLNGEVVLPYLKESSSYNFRINLRAGDNIFEATAKGLDGLDITEKLSMHIKTDAEIEQERIAQLKADKLAAEEEKKKQLLQQEEERQNRIRLEKEEKARIAEQKRIEREGDGTPDDLLCKKYGLKPQTQSYGECRMRLDLSHKEDERQQRQMELQTQLERQRQAQQQKQLEQQRQLAIQAQLQREQQQKAEKEALDAQYDSRKSHCLFLKAQEYLRPVAGGFPQSWQNAESVFANCMAGVPQINTTCSKDAFGNLNCTSR